MSSLHVGPKEIQPALSILCLQVRSHYEQLKGNPKYRFFFHLQDRAFLVL